MTSATNKHKPTIMEGTTGTSKFVQRNFFVFKSTYVYLTILGLDGRKRKAETSNCVALTNLEATYLHLTTLESLSRKKQGETLKMTYVHATVLQSVNKEKKSGPQPQCVYA